MQELDAMNPEMEPQQTAGTPDGGTDREGAMAKADLYKLANYSHKLFQQMHDDDQLEAWVQAKITKAADYIASVYHYLEYEMKFSEYGHHLDNSDTLSEGQKMKLKEVLAEAKMKMADLKKSQAEKIKEDRKEDTKTQHGTATSTYDNDGKRKSVVHKDERKYSDEPHGEVASNAKSKSAADKKKEAPEQKMSPKSAKTWGMKNSEKFDNRDKVMDENMEPCDHCGGAGHVPKAPVRVHPAHAEKVAKYNRQTKAFHAASKRIDANNNGIPDEDEGLAEAKKKGDGNLANNAKPYDKVTRGDVISGRLGKDEKGGKSVKEAAKWRDPKHKDKLYTQEPRDYDQYDYHDDDYYNGPKPDDYPGEKNLKGGGEFVHNDPLVKGYGRGGTGSMNTHGKRKGMPSRDHVSSLKGSIKSALGTHPRPNLPEAAKPSSGLSKEKKSAVVKDAKAGKDLGKPGKSFDKVAKSAGGGEKGKKIAAAAMWKNIKETTAYVAEKAEVEKKAKKDYDGDGKVESGKVEHAGSVDKAIKANKAKETVKESSDLTRMKQLMTRLNG